MGDEKTSDTSVTVPTDEQMDLYKNIDTVMEIRRAARFVAICRSGYERSKREADEANNRLISANHALATLIAKLE